MADHQDDAYERAVAEPAYARKLLDRALTRPRALLRKLVIGDAIGERPETALPRDQRRRR